MERAVPKDILLEAIIEDVCFHPNKEVIACGDIDGQVGLHSYSTSEENHVLMILKHHKKACRAVHFSPTGDRLFTASKDKSLQMVDVSQGTVAQSINKAHSAGLYSLLPVDENIVVTGDDDGYLKVWDMRYQRAVMEEHQNEEFISDMVLVQGQRLLLATSGDGTLTAFDIRKHKMKMQSELFDSELLSLALIKNGDKVVCGTGDGTLNIFNYGEWSNFSDRFPGHPVSVDCIVPLSDDIICTGSFDGNIRVVHILPNRFMGVIGQHEEFPVESLTLTDDRSLLASCSHDQRIKFWDVSNLPQKSVNPHKKAKKSNVKKKIGTNKSRGSFFADMMGGGPEGESSKAGEGGDSDSDEDDSSENEDSDDKSSEVNVTKRNDRKTANEVQDSNQGDTSLSSVIEVDSVDEEDVDEDIDSDDISSVDSTDEES